MKSVYITLFVLFALIAATSAVKTSSGGRCRGPGFDCASADSPDNCGPCGTEGSICYIAFGQNQGKCGDVVSCTDVATCVGGIGCGVGEFCAENTCCGPDPICVPIC